MGQVVSIRYVKFLRCPEHPAGYVSTDRIYELIGQLEANADLEGVVLYSRNCTHETRMKEVKKQ